MKITYIRIKRIKENTKSRLLFFLKGIASITFDNAFVVHNIKIFENEKGVFLGMPSIRRKIKLELEEEIKKEELEIKKIEEFILTHGYENIDKEKFEKRKEELKKKKRRRFLDIANPINSETRQIIVKEISHYYKEMIKNSNDKIDIKLNSDVDHNNFHVTSVRIKKKYKSQNRLKGIASITFDNSFAVRNIKIIQGDEGIFIAMPSVPKFPKENENNDNIEENNDNIEKLEKNYPNNKKNVDSEVTDDNDEDSPEFLDIAHPINSEVRNKIESVIKKYFEEMIKRSEDSIEIENL